MASARIEKHALHATRRASPSVVLAAAGALLLGVFLLYGVGFAQPELLHNAGHDARHALAFPCH